MKRFSSTTIGIFVLGALVLAVIGLISFGAQSWWRDREYVVVYFGESVHGLDQGSAVKLMGVPVGRVSSINVSYQGQAGTVVQVVCEIDRSPFVLDAAGDQVDIRKPQVMQQLVDRGLQARLNILGITGMLYLEMGFFAQLPEDTFKLEHPEYVVVPSTPSVFGGLTDQLAEIAVEVGDIDFAGLAASATRLMDTTSAAIEEAKIEELFVKLHEAVGDLNELLESDELQRVILTAGESFGDLSRLARRLESEVEPLSENLAVTSDELRQTLREVGRTFEGIQEMIGPRLGIGRQFGDTLQTIDDAARSVERLADFLERNPQSIVRGRANGD